MLVKGGFRHLRLKTITPGNKETVRERGEIFSKMESAIAKGYKQHIKSYTIGAYFVGQ